MNRELQQLPATIFNCLTNLTQLDLSNCGLIQIDQNILSGLTSLVKVKLGDNPITFNNKTYVESLCSLYGLKCEVDEDSY